MNTLLHAVCCLVIYFAWWHKPYSVEEPVTIDTSPATARSTCAWMVMDSRSGLRRTALSGPLPGYMSKASLYLCHETVVEDRTARSRNEHLQFSNLSWNPADENGRWLRTLQEYKTKNAAQRRPEEVILDEAVETQRLVEDEQSTSLKLCLGQQIHGFYLTTQCSKAGNSQQLPPDPYVRLSLGELECLRLANALHRSSSAGSSWNFSEEASFESKWLTEHAHEIAPLNLDLVRFLCPNPLTRIWKDLAESLFTAALLSASSLYGGLHLLAWHGPFATGVERYMWNASCITIASLGPGWLLWWIAQSLHGCKVDRLEWLRMVVNDCENSCDCFFMCFMALVWSLAFCLYVVAVVAGAVVIALIPVYCLAYVAARVYLIVECFINLAHLPPGVYKEPQWSQFVPYFGAG
jgi:hypothetical protein